jgi:rubrerythrin
MANVNMDALVDKLCERLAAETGGVEIYQAALDKLSDPDAIARLEKFARDELAHRHLLTAYLDKLGVEDRATTSARLARLETDALVRIVAEAETPAQVLNVLLMFELMDENAWEMIIDLGRDIQDEEMVRTLNAALRDEKEHLRGVRGLVAEELRARLAAVVEPTGHLL